MSAFRYTHAIVCRVPNSFKTSALGTDGKNIDLELAKRQHEKYVAILRGIGLDVLELPPDEQHPDCVFVEDAAIVCNGSALICRPGHESRREEVKYMRKILQNELDIPVHEVQDENATLDGGDVLFTGKEFFVGLSSRTNSGGAAAVAEAFPEFPCSPIKVDDALHLKTMMTMAGPDVICVGNSPKAQEAIKTIERLATFRYKTLTVPDNESANVLFANGTLMYSEVDPESTKIFESRMSHWDLKPISMTEFSKADGSLTCPSILIRKTKHLKHIM